MSGTGASPSKTFASLGPMLLARKGSAKPAMRPQLGPIATAAVNDHEDDLADAQNLLGWNDMGEDEHWSEDDEDDQAVMALTPMEAVEPEPAVIHAAPEVHRQQTELVERIAAEIAEAAPLPAKRSVGKGRRSAFTLRLDTQRHLKLRLASTIAGESAQKLVTQALDRLLDSMPEIDSLAAQVRRD